MLSLHDFLFLSSKILSGLPEIRQIVKVSASHILCSLAFARMPRTGARGGMATGGRAVARRAKAGWTFDELKSSRRGELKPNEINRNFRRPTGMNA
jgi:hypothetical protein